MPAVIKFGQKKINRIYLFGHNTLSHYKTHGLKSVARKAFHLTTSMIRVGIAKFNSIAHAGNPQMNEGGPDFTHDPLVTVISVNYNGARDLPMFLHSLSQQSYRNFELIIVDNGSSDNSKDLVNQQDARPPRTHFLCAEKNLGFAEGNNFAMKHAKGELIALLNVDTKVHEDWLRELVEALRSNDSAAAATSKILFWSRFENLTIESDAKIGIDLKALTDSLSYKKYFLRSGVVENGLIVSDSQNRLELSLPIQETQIQFKLNLSSPADGYVRFNARNKILLGLPFSECDETISIDFSLSSLTNAGFIINNSGSITGRDGMPRDRGFGEYDRGQYDTKSYVPYFCGCSVLIRRAAILERPIFIPEFFAYYEDSELSRWLTHAGHRILYAPRSIVFHRHSATSTEGSPLWRFLVRRSSLIFSYDGNIPALSRNLDNAQKEFKPHLTPEIKKTLSDYDHSLLNKLLAGKFYDRPQTIGIYNKFWNTKGGGESHALSIASELQKLGPVELISESDFDLDALAQYFSLDLSNCRKLILPKITTEFTEKFFLFINSTFGSNLPSRAENSWYIVSFPHRFAPVEFLRSYHFLFNSNYTQKWAHTYWGDKINGEVIYPVRMFRPNQKNAPQRPSDCRKQKVILSVGRFFPSGHCKNQLEIAEAYRLLVSDLPQAREWKLILAGSLDTRHPEHIAYYKAVQDKLRDMNAEVLPNISPVLLDKLYSDASIYVHAAGMNQAPTKFPENFEHFGITPLEAMLAGAIPVVFSIGGPAELIDQLDIGYKFSSHKSLVDVLAQLIVRDTSSLHAESASVSISANEFVASEKSKSLPRLNFGNVNM